MDIKDEWMRQREREQQEQEATVALHMNVLWVFKQNNFMQMHPLLVW